jgi:uncharacterized protein involved in exopolysaccharide biosynthesis
MPNSPSLLLDWRILLGQWRILLVAVVLSAGVGLVLTLPAISPPEYASRASFIVPSISDVVGARISGIAAGRDADMEQIAGALTSDTAQAFVDRQLGLQAHYGIRSRDSEGSKAFLNRYQENVRVQVGRHSSVEIEVYDTDPVIASRLAWALIAFADSAAERAARRRPALAASGQALAKLEARRARLLDSLSILRTRFRLYNLKDLGEGPSLEVVRSMQADPAARANYDRLVSYETELLEMEKPLANLRNEYTQRQANLLAYPSLIGVLTPPRPADFPTRPKRLLTLLGAMFAGLLAASAFILWQAHRRGSAR